MSTSDIENAWIGKYCTTKRPQTLRPADPSQRLNAREGAAGEILYLERSWDHETDEGWEAWIPPLFGERTVAGADGQRRSPEYDEAFFFEEGDEQEQERRRNSVTLFAIHFRRDVGSSSSPLTLRTVCEVLLDYHDKHPAYILLDANCWAWSRAILLAVVSKADNVSSIVINKKSEPVTPEQFKMYLFTEYGAWGGMLLHVIGAYLLFY